MKKATILEAAGLIPLHVLKLFEEGHLNLMQSADRARMPATTFLRRTAQMCQLGLAPAALMQNPSVAANLPRAVTIYEDNILSGEKMKLHARKIEAENRDLTESKPGGKSRTRSCRPACPVRTCPPFRRTRR